ncbi:ATP-binding protein [Bordetella bronchialis]|uniref:ATP-binding protein n=1 Tax=Bordetella bronchialis TaxID=463025 RepID=UPI0009F1B827|nr:ATP-binding protein [Bordetella bronchialis]
MRVLKTRLLNAILWLASLLGLALPGDANAGQALELPPNQEVAISLQPYAEAYEDSTGRLDFDQIRELHEKNPEIFQPAEIQRPARARLGSAWWLRTDIANASDRMRRVVVVAGPPNLEEVDFYVAQAGQELHTRAGTRVPILQQQDLTRYPALRLQMAAGDTARIWIRIKSPTPYTLTPVAYTDRLFRTAMHTTMAYDGILVGAGSALVWCTMLVAIVGRRMPFFWLSAIAAGALLREAAAREYLQRLTLPLDGNWGYRLEFTLDVIHLALCALFIRSAARREIISIPGTRVYTNAVAGLSGGLLIAALLPGQAAWPVQTAVWLYQALAAALSLCLLGSAVMLAGPARLRAGRPTDTHAQVTAALLALAGIFIALDAAVRTIGPLLPTPLIPVTLILDSGSPPLALLGVAGNLTVLTLWAARLSGNPWRTRIAAHVSPDVLARPVAEAGSGGAIRMPPGAAPDVPVPPANTVPPPAGLPPGSVDRPAPAHPRGALPTAASGTVPGASDAAPRRDAEGSIGDDRQALILSYVGHDLRAPLAIISGYIRMLRQAATPHQHAYLDVIERSVAHQFELVDEILAYSKSELQPFTVSAESVELRPLMEEFAHFGIALCTHQRNRFEYLPVPRLPALVLLDVKRLRQAVLNLLSNAAKFTSEGIVRLDARVRGMDGPRPELDIGVFNDGMHIPEADQGRIFVAFRQLHRREAGLGLGLFIVERIATAMGGSIDVESAPERGTRFTLTVPVKLVDRTLVATRPIGGAPMPAAGGPARQLEAPPLAVRLVLARLARDGELSEIEAWVSGTRDAYPQYTTFYDEVARCVDSFDMECLLRLALQGTTGP